MEDAGAAGSPRGVAAPAPLPPGPAFFFASSFCRRDPDADDHPRLDDVELSIEPGATGFEFSRRRRTVDHTAFLRFHRPTLDDVGQPQLLPFQTDLSQGLVEQPPGWPCKRPTRLLFDDPRSLTDEHHLGIDIAFAEDHPEARGSIRASWAGERL